MKNMQKVLLLVSVVSATAIQTILASQFASEIYSRTASEVASEAETADNEREAGGGGAIYAPKIASDSKITSNIASTYKVTFIPKITSTKYAQTTQYTQMDSSKSSEFKKSNSAIPYLPLPHLYDFNTNDSNTPDAKPQKSTKSQDLQAKDLGKVVAKGYKDAGLESRERYQSSAGEISRSMLESNPNGNGDITSILKILPNVQYDTRQNSSSTPGEINPANISISGGLYYQNNFQIDGFNMNNDLDPANSSSYTAVTALPGQSQGLNIDTALLESISVQDSNVSALYSGFTGGVVEAKTKRAAKKFGANISYQISQGNANPKKPSMTKYHIHTPTDANYANFLNSSSAGNQPEFIKHSIRASLESKITKKLGIIASFTTTQSFIPLNSGSSLYLAATLDEKRKTQKRQSYNFFIKGHYDVLDNLTLEASYAYMPQYNNYFIINTKNSGFDMLSGGHQGGLKASWDNAKGFFRAQMNINYMDNSRVNSAPNMMGWRASAEKNWTNDLQNGNVSEGSYGNVNTRQLNTALKITQDFNPLTLGIWRNDFNIGAEYGYVNAFYERVEDMWFFGNAFMIPLTKGQTCLAGDIACSTSPVYFQGKAKIQRQEIDWVGNVGQYAYRTSFYKAGKINLDNHTLGVFAEDDMRFDLRKGGELNMRFGLRVDYDTLMSKSTLSPRFSLNYVLPWSKWGRGRDFATQLTFGASRYYGRNLFVYKLMDSRSAFEYTLQRDIKTYTSWDNATSTQNKNDTNFKKMRVPYSNELMGGIVQHLYALQISAKYIYRGGRDEIRRMCQAPDGSISSYNCASNVAGLTSDLRYVYTNEGRSDTDVISLAVQNHKSLDFGSVKNHILFAFDWSNVRRNYEDYTSSITEGELANEWIYYGGQVIQYANRPATNFTRPYTIRLNTTTSFSIGRFKWLWNNFFRVRSSYNAMASIGQRTQRFNEIKAQYPQITAAFEKYRVPASFNWDMRVGFEVGVWKSNILYANLDIINVLDNQNLMIASASFSQNAGTTAVPVYELGRQFWVQVGYKF